MKIITIITLVTILTLITASVHAKVYIIENQKGNPNAQCGYYKLMNIGNNGQYYVINNSDDNGQYLLIDMGDC